MHDHFHFKIRQLVMLLNLVSVTKIFRTKTDCFFPEQTNMKLLSVDI